ncbi:aldehyde dehydrogenase 1-like [Dioscorea cayenensis subsp. rotundata]|uniref:Aldehyde dehydrogenase 1-like n=1 Tax=Dioscorea cayennensis subsp. rotundata TaxID=55577 RepID=A0AB40CVL9_DIOCR|nr:aldehyde dehydrogenase 1-like [Dioscorea cayenensis subsp. rotundata]
MKQLTSLFPNKITIQIPQDEAQLLDWKQELDRDVETLKAKANILSIRFYFCEEDIVVTLTIEEAIEKANSTKYGLAAGIVTKDLNTTNRVSRSIRSGVIWINCYFAFDRDCPYGGYKMSGFGRDLGLNALDKYLQVKSVVTPIFGSPWL